MQAQTEIRNAADLEGIQLNGNYVLKNDIDMNGVNWTPVGDRNLSFDGTFDGAGYKIYNLDITYLSEIMGFFGHLGANAHIKNLNVDIINFNGNHTSWSGGLAGYNEGVIENCNVTGNIAGGHCVGGLVGDNDGSIINSSFAGNVSGDYNIGGIAGHNLHGQIRNCIFKSGVVSGNTILGGIAGGNEGEINSCHSAGYITGDEYVGGIAGENIDIGKINNCYYTGVVSGRNNAGGLVGRYTGSAGSYIKNSYSAGSVQGAGESDINIGGLIGEISGDTVYENCYFSIDNTEQAYGAGSYGYVNHDELVGLRNNEMRGANAKINMEGFDWGGTWTTIENNFPQPIAITSNPKAGGSGKSKNDPYLIYNAVQLVGLSNDVAGNESYEDKYLKMMNDISLENYNTGEGWIPIGESKSFTGNFDGAGHKITHLYINTVNDFAGLFYYLDEAGIIMNLGVESVNIEGRSHVGGLVAINSGYIDNCYVTGNLAATGNLAGGLVAYNFGTVSNCYTGGNIDGNEIVGGLVGSHKIGKITHSYSTSNVTATESGGGFVGSNEAIIEICYATGDVDGGINTGGFAGDTQGNKSNISNCYSSGAVYGENTAGGFIGISNGSIISNCYTSGQTDGNNFVGSFMGLGASSLENCYFATDLGTNGIGDSQTPAGLSGLTSGEMQDIEAKQNMTGFDWNRTWVAIEGDYPQLAAFVSNPETGGSGDSENDPYLIFNTNQYVNLASIVNNGNNDYSGKHFKLMEDLNLAAYGENHNDGKGWQPIGNETFAFNGSFDGAGNKISNLYINRPDEDNVGVFGSVGIDGHISNLNVEARNVTGNINVGGLVGISSGHVSNSSVSGMVRGMGYIGGLVGYGNATSVVENSYSQSNVTGMRYIGGLVGYTNGNIEICSAHGNIHGIATSKAAFPIGGLVGYSGGNILNSYASGAVSSANNIKIGGLVGHSASTSVIANSYYNSYNNNAGIGSADNDRQTGTDKPTGVSRVDMAVKGLSAMPNLTAGTGAGQWIDSVIGAENDSVYYMPVPAPFEKGGSIVIYSLTFDANGKVDVSNNNMFGVSGEKIEIPDIVAETSFTGWINNDNNTIYNATDSIALVKHTTLHAQWTSVVRAAETSLLAVYPNPATNRITISGLEGVEIISVINIAGVPVINLSAASETETVSINHLPEGVYFIKVVKDGETETVKIRIR